MKITWHRRSLHLKNPFNIARMPSSKSTDKTVLLVQIEHDGKIGWGEAAPISYYHQTLDSAEAAFAQAGALLGDDPFALEAIHARLWKQFPDQSAAIAAIDGALHDLIGKLLDIPVWKLLGLDRSLAPLTCITIGLEEPAVMAQWTRDAAEFPILKIKIGTPRDEEMMAAVRGAAPDKVLRVDANCGWKSEQVLDKCRMLQRFNVEFVEQPTPRGEHAALPAVRAAGLCQLVADESSIGPEDVLACRGFFDGINIKLSKCGGIRRALQMIHTARSAGLKIMLGCMVETSVGLAAAAHLAPLVDWVDLDGHLLLADDPFEGLGGAGGRLTLNDRPGLGVGER